MSDIKLFNKGQRTIIVDGGEIRPQQTVAIAKEEAEKLQKLFVGELINTEEAVKVFKDAKPVKGKAKAEDNK